MAFVNYHKHSMYTNARQSDVACFVTEYVERIKNLKQNVLSTVEHGWIGNVIAYYEECKKNNLKLLIGTEAYWVKDMTEKDKTNCHICILARNENGRKAINRALTKGNIDGFYFQPRLDVDTILNLPKDDIWCTTACIAFYKYGDEYSKEFILKLHDHFQDNFYLELQAHNDIRQKEVNRNLLGYSKEYGIKYICGLDSHYIFPDDSKKRDFYIESRNIKYPEESNFILDFPDEKTVYDRFMLQGILSSDEAITAIKNTYEFENVEEYTGECFNKNIKMPVPLKYKNYTQEEKTKKLHDIVYKEYYKYSKDFSEDKKREYEKEIDDNLSVIKEISHEDYFLGNYEFIKRGKELGCMLSPTGRGSSVSFLVNFFLGFTKVDKLRSTVPLYADRFLSAKRILDAHSLADIDHNAAYPEKIKEAIDEVYGKSHAYPLITFGTLKAKASWKMYARVNNIDFDVANLVSEQIGKYEMDVKHASDEEKELIDVKDYIDPQYHDLYDESMQYLKLVNSLSVHPCANLLYSENIIEEFGLIMVSSENGKKKTLCVCADGNWIESYKFLKADLLKVDVSKLIYRLYQRIGRDVIPIDTLVEKADECDAWSIYANGITMGINQVEQEGSRIKAMNYKPHSIAELSSLVAAVRPGFKSLYKLFERREKVSYGVPSIDNMLKSSGGYILYQENVMAILNYAGYEMSECYTMLKAIAKKKPEIVKKCNEEFHQMMKNKLINVEGLSEEKAIEVTSKIWQVISDCCGYAFNASHSMCVSLDGLYVALIKKKFPIIFYEVYINLLDENQDKDKIIMAKDEAAKYFKILFPKPKFHEDNRNSKANIKNNSISASLKSIKKFSNRVSESLYNLGNKQYNSFYDVLKEIECGKYDINTSHVDILISIGYFSEFGSISTLSKFYECYKELHGRKQFNISKEFNSIAKINTIAIFCGDKTEKTLKDFKEDDFFSFIWDKLSILKDNIKDIIRNENEYLGQIYTTDFNAPTNLYFVKSINIKQSIISVLYRIKDGKQVTVKIRKKVFDENQFGVNEMMKVYDISQDPRYIFKGKDEKGKNIFEKDYSQMEDILKDYFIITDKKENDDA